MPFSSTLQFCHLQKFSDDFVALYGNNHLVWNLASGRWQVLACATGRQTRLEVQHWDCLQQSRLYFLKLRCFNVCRRMLQMFYQSVVASEIFFVAICWGSSIRASNTKKLNKMFKKSGDCSGAPLFLYFSYKCNVVSWRSFVYFTWTITI